jgi:HSP20 family protein
MAYWNIFKDLETLRKELNRMLPADEWRLPFSRIAFLPAMGARQYPMLNMAEDSENVYIEALAPGVDTEKLDISVQGTKVTISGEKISSLEAVNQENYHRCERAAGKFVRTVDLNTNVDNAKVKAEYKNGLLTITLPKAESAKPKRISITAG